MKIIFWYLITGVAIMFFFFCISMKSVLKTILIYYLIVQHIDKIKNDSKLNRYKKKFLFLW